MPDEEIHDDNVVEQPELEATVQESTPALEPLLEPDSLLTEEQAMNIAERIYVQMFDAIRYNTPIRNFGAEKTRLGIQVPFQWFYESFGADEETAAFLESKMDKLAGFRTHFKPFKLAADAIDKIMIKRSRAGDAEARRPLYAKAVEWMGKSSQIFEDLDTGYRIESLMEV